MNTKNIIKHYSGSVHIVNTNSGSGTQINNFSNNTITVNGKKITLPKNYNSMTINNGVVIIDGVRYDGEEVSEVRKERKEKTISFDENILDILSKNANICVEIVEEEQSKITFDENQHSVKIKKDKIVIEDIVKEITSEVIIKLNKKQVNKELRINSDNGDIKVFGIKDMLNIYLSVKTDNGDIKIDNWKSDDYVLVVSDNGDVKTDIDCLFTSIKTDNGDVKGNIKVYNDSIIKTDNGDIKISTSSKVKAITELGDVEINNNVSDKSVITAISELGDIEIY